MANRLSLRRWAYARLDTFASTTYTSTVAGNIQQTDDPDDPPQALSQEPPSIVHKTKL